MIDLEYVQGDQGASLEEGGKGRVKGSRMLKKRRSESVRAKLMSVAVLVMSDELIWNQVQNEGVLN